MTDERDDLTDSNHPLYHPKLDPTHQSYGEGSEDGAPKVEPSEDAYKIGPGFPPKESKWKPGCPSPNSKGRPKKIPSMKPDLKKALEDSLNEKVVITKDKREVVLTKAALGIQQLVHQYAKGDRHARRDLFQIAAQLGVDLQAKSVVEEALGVANQAALDDYVRRRYAELSGQAAPQEHVKAPPDLIDDDVTEPEPDETLAHTPQPGTSAKKLDDPVLGDDGRPLSVSDIRYVREINRRRLAQQRKNQGES
jgi:Family of unknown function (DUF5681)